MNKMIERECIVCGCKIWWDDSQAPVACFEHTYGEVYKAAQLERPLDGGKAAAELAESGIEIVSVKPVYSRRHK